MRGSPPRRAEDGFRALLARPALCLPLAQDAPQRSVFPSPARTPRFQAGPEWPHSEQLATCRAPRGCGSRSEAERTLGGIGTQGISATIRSWPVMSQEHGQRGGGRRAGTRGRSPVAPDDLVVQVGRQALQVAVVVHIHVLQLPGAT